MSIDLPEHPQLAPGGISTIHSGAFNSDVHLPAGKGRELVMMRYTQPDKDLQLLLARMSLELPQQPPPQIRPCDQRKS